MRVRLRISPQQVVVDVMEAVGRECVPVAQALAESWDQTQDVLFKPELDAAVVQGVPLDTQQPVAPPQEQALGERLRRIMVNQKGR